DETTLYTNKCAGPDDDWRDKVVKIKSEGTAGTTTRAVEVAVAAAGDVNAFVGFDGTDCPGPSNHCTIRASKNVSYVERIGAGDYRVYFATPMSNTNYAVVSGAGGTVPNGLVWQHTYEYDTQYAAIATRSWPNNAGDAEHVSIAVFK
ncbi:MAG: hypothetical protein KBD19_05040, partial [Candidatus Moranbacteria bacterium]|nr:hypothetical protein [Candidatus Moranbacteria bacterium]